MQQVSSGVIFLCHPKRYGVSSALEKAIDYFFFLLVTLFSNLFAFVAKNCGIHMSLEELRFMAGGLGVDWNFRHEAVAVP